MKHGFGKLALLLLKRNPIWLDSGPMQSEINLWLGLTHKSTGSSAVGCFSYGWERHQIISIKISRFPCKTYSQGTE